ncbi:MAG: hypothetical protein ACK5NT_06770, partial [Pyrinomonadaceae bacterium]
STCKERQTHRNFIMAKRDVTIKINFDDKDGARAAERMTRRFQEMASAADKSISSQGKALSNQLSKDFASGGEREYLESIRRLAPELKTLHQNIKNGSIDIADYRRRMELLPRKLSKVFFQESIRSVWS